MLSMQRIALVIAGVALEIQEDAPDLPVWLTQTCRAFHVSSTAIAHPHPLLVIHRNPQFARTEQGLVYELLDAPGSFRIHGFDFTAIRRRCDAPIEIEAHPEAGMAGVARWLMSLLLLEAEGFMFHAASFAHEGSGIICAGPSGAGKTTLSRLLLPRSDVALFTDESTAFRFQGDMAMIYATPFAGELGPVSGPASAPLETAFFLKHAPANSVRRLRAAEVVTNVVGSTFLAVRHGAWIESCFTLAERLARSVPCSELGFRPEPNVWETIHDVIQQAVPTT